MEHAELSLTQAIDYAKHLEQQLADERAKRGSAEVQLGYQSQNCMRLIALVRLCREHIFLGQGNTVPGELLQELLYFDRVSSSHFDEAQRAYADYLATYVEPLLQKEVRTPPSGKSGKKQGFLTSRRELIFAIICSLTIAYFYFTGKA